MRVSDQQDASIRSAAFRWLESQVQIHGDVLPRKLLAEGYIKDGKQIKLLGPKGIFKPADLDIPLSITTIPDGPYDDGYLTESLIHYRYRGPDPLHPDNRGLREAMRRQIPLIYFYRVVKARYLCIWPVFIVDDDPGRLSFTVQVDEANKLLYPQLENVEYGEIKEEELRRSYITATVRQRVHQRSFRERVIKAYHEQCAMCKLRHYELLDAAHIIPDGEPDGDPVVSNGLSLCKLHHAAFDRNFLGIRPDYVIEVREDILNEDDGPMLLHGLKEMHGKHLMVPRGVKQQPSEQLLERRFSRFLNAI